MCGAQALSVFEVYIFDDCPSKTTLVFSFQSFSYIFITKIQLFLNFHWKKDLAVEGVGVAITEWTCHLVAKRDRKEHQSVCRSLVPT